MVTIFSFLHLLTTAMHFKYVEELHLNTPKILKFFCPTPSPTSFIRVGTSFKLGTKFSRLNKYMKNNIICVYHTKTRNAKKYKIQL